MKVFRIITAIVIIADVIQDLIAGFKGKDLVAIKHLCWAILLTVIWRVSCD